MFLLGGGSISTGSCCQIRDTCLCVDIPSLVEAVMSLDVGSFKHISMERDGSSILGFQVLGEQGACFSQPSGPSMKIFLVLYFFSMFLSADGNLPFSSFCVIARIKQDSSASAPPVLNYFVVLS